MQNWLNEAGIGLDHYANGFFTDSGRHLGTHTNKFFEFLHDKLQFAVGDRTELIQVLKQVGDDLKNGVITF